jgi:aryl-alcohol dehydrogenase-like predicted oxidoreductase
MSAAKRKLGRTEIDITPIGLGCWQFSQGRGLGGSFWPALEQTTIDDIVKAALTGGINWFDTAEAYGNGASEQALARALKAAGKQNGDVVVATKWLPLFRFASSIGVTIDERLRSLDGFAIDLYQIHQPYSFSSTRNEMEEMAYLATSGKIRNAGVSNFSAKAMRKAHAALAEHDLPLASNQVRYNLLDRRIESNGVLQAAKELGITIIAYSPLAQGLLSGRYHDEPELLKKVAGPRHFLPSFSLRNLERTQPLVLALKDIAHDHNATATQIALAWLTQFHGETVVAIPGATSPGQVTDHVAAMQVTLSREELDTIDHLSR